MMAQLDPRSKLTAVFLFIFLVIWTPGDAYLRFLLYFLMASGLIAASGISLLTVLRRFFWMIPLLGFLILSLVLFSPLAPAEKALVARELGIKTGLCLLALLVLTRTADFTSLIQGLQKWKVPSVITSLFTFAQRYMSLFLQEIETTFRAWTSRRFGRTTKWDSIKMTARLAPHVLFNSLSRSEAIYAAMLSRGFDGRLPSRNPFRLKCKDYAFMLGFGLAAVIIQVMVP
jgi:cobalt/nickel transport system permease protein